MTLEVLVSTMMQEDYRLLDRMRIESDAVIVNQCNTDEIVTFGYKGYRIKWINTSERGLSRSRNMAIRNATADVCMIADDDIEYTTDYVDTVCGGFEETGADILQFEVEGIEKKFKSYPKRKRKVGYLGALKVSSVELVFLRRKIENIEFDEKIGAGTQFYMGEENAFLYACLNNKLKINFVPQQISYLHMGESTWYEGMNEKYFVSRGAAFAALKTRFTKILILQFALRKYKLYKENISMRKAIKCMMLGRKEYIDAMYMQI